MRIEVKCCLEGGGSEIRTPDPPSFFGRIYRIAASPLIIPGSTKKYLIDRLLTKEEATPYL